MLEKDILVNKEYYKLQALELLRHVGNYNQLFFVDEHWILKCTGLKQRRNWFLKQYDIYYYKSMIWKDVKNNYTIKMNKNEYNE